MVQELYIWAFTLFFFVALLGSVLYLTLLGHRQEADDDVEAVETADSADS